MIAKRLLSALLAVSLVVALAPLAHAQSDVSAVLHVDANGNQMQMRMTASGQNLRLDMDSPQGEASLVWTDAAMLMIMHAQRMYMEFTREMMERMQGMMGQMANMPQADAPGFDPEDMANVTFNTTGATDTINGMSAFEVEVTNSEGKSASLWMTTDTEVGMFEVMTRLSEAFENMSMPGMQQGGGAGIAAMRSSMALARAQGMPDGVVIRVVDRESGSTITLGEVDTSAVAASMFAAPAGYTKQSMPFQN